MKNNLRYRVFTISCAKLAFPRRDITFVCYPGAVARPRAVTLSTTLPETVDIFVHVGVAYATPEQRNNVLDFRKKKKKKKGVKVKRTCTYIMTLFCASFQHVTLHAFQYSLPFYVTHFSVRSGER
ncbi:hypothetical protein PUN28_001835 [Cardiocondyla obscurior]|uniref:Uncharacterized protein n=1 Tax=Cardiocondyla obscurior TaxID=286306 RepID=A0AAW2GRM1_9HYME